MTAPTRIDGKQEQVSQNDNLTEINRASLALRSVQPDLEAWPIGPVDTGPVSKPRSMWPVVVTMWIAVALLSVAVATAVSFATG